MKAPPAGEAGACALAGWCFDLVLSSLSSALKPPEWAGFEALDLDPDLVEWDYGEYDGLTTAQIRERNPGWVLGTGDLG